MLILPIVNKNRILNVQVTLRGAEKVRSSVSISDIDESDILVNGRSFSKSYFYEGDNSKTMVDFIRTNLNSQNKVFTVTTKRGKNSNLCDVYEVEVPPVKICDQFDTLYSKALLDMEKETPGLIKSKYLSFEKVGFGEIFSDKNVSKLRQIVSNVYDKSYWMGMFQDEGLVPMLQIINLMNIFEFTVVSEASIREEIVVEMLESLDKINSKDTKSLRNYYNMALDNRDIYGKMSYVSKMVYDRTFNLIQSSSQRKQNGVRLVKVEERELNQVA